MCPGVEGVEGTSKGHDAIATKLALPYLKAKGHTKAAEYLESLSPITDSYKYEGSGEKGSMRTQAGLSIVNMLGKMSEAQRVATQMVIDSDLGCS